MPEQLKQIINGISNAIETVPELYQDAFQPTLQETGKFTSRIPRAINAAFSGLDKWILNKEYSVDETKKLLAQKLENVEPDKIVEPEPYVAVPAIQAITYTMNSDKLRSLYANLLAKSMNIDTKDTVHPAFLETIKQLSPDDATYFKHLCSLEKRPIIDVNLRLQNSLIITIAKNTTIINEDIVYNYELALDNLCRLGLINIPDGIYYGEDSVYEQLIGILSIQFPFEKYKNYNPDAIEIYFQKKRIDITSYGKSFYDTCVI